MTISTMDQIRLKGLVVEAITNLCKSGLSFKSEFSVEGLLGITLDNDGVFLINIKETFSSSRVSDVCVGTEQRDFCDLSGQASLACGVTDGSYLTGAPVTLTSSLDVNKAGLLCDRADKQDAFQLNAIDLNISNNKLTDLEILFDLSTTPGKKKDLLPMPMDMTTAFLEQEGVEQLMDKTPDAKQEDDEEMSDASELAIIKQEHHLMQAVEQSTHSHTGLSKNDLTLISLDNINTQPADNMFLNLKPGDYQLPACSGWDGTDYFDAVPLNLSEAQEIVEPQDLSIHQAKQPKVRLACDFCAKKFRSEAGLKKHKDKEHSDAGDADKPEALALVVKEPVITQPLDLTTGRSENEGDGDVDDFEHDLQLRNQDPFNCVCGKVISDYESYIEHVTACSKSKLTPCKSCELCGKYFFSNSGYVKHKRLHQGSYKFHCEICHKGFFDRTHLRNHTDSRHSKVRHYKCDFCNKSFYWKHHLKRHKVSCDKAKEFTFKE